MCLQVHHEYPDGSYRELYDDPIFFAPDPDAQDLDEYLYHEEDFPEAPITKALGASTLYSIVSISMSHICTSITAL